MGVIENLNKALDYIEENIESEIDFHKVSQIAGCSEYHFRRMFSSLSCMPIGEYIRNRRLTISASIIFESDEKIIDIAMRYGYESPDAFTKAFHAYHGVTPMQLRKEKGSYNTFLPMQFHLSIRGGNIMECRVVEKETFYIIGVNGRIPLIYHGPNPHVSEVWGKLSQENLLLLMGYSEIEPKGIIGAYTNYEDKNKEGTMHDLYVGIVTEKLLPERLMPRFTTLKVESSKWAVFTTRGAFPESVQEVWGKIFDTWFPSSNYELIPGPEINWSECYDFGKPDFKSEIWIPIKEN